MKRSFLNKLLGIISIFFLCFGFLLSVNANTVNNKYSITISGAGPNHTYQVYQIFTGNIKIETNQIGDAQWGTGVNSGDLLAELKASSFQVDERVLNSDGINSSPTGQKTTIGKIFGSCSTANDVSLALSPYQDDSEAVREFAQIVGKHLTTVFTTAVRGTDGKYKAGDLAAGYYFIKDAGRVENDAQTRYILNLNKDQEIVVKGEAPSMSKTVNNGKTYAKSADFQIGDIIEFRIEGTLPNKDVYDSYKKYKYVFHDTLPEMLKFVGTESNNWKVEVYSGDKLIANVKDNFHFVPAASGFSINCDDLKQIGALNSKISELASTDNITIVLTYYVTLTSTDNFQFKNQNDAYLEFSDNPNSGGENSTSNTPHDKVTIYTYILNIEKINGRDGTIKLANVGFKLYREINGEKKWAVVKNGVIQSWTSTEKDGTEMFTSNSGTLSISGLDSATYVLVETTTLDGFNTMKDMEFTITANLSDNQTINSLQLIIQSEDGQSQNGNVNNGVLSATILNYPGGVLPSTGGIGTIIFYIVGVVLIVTSLVLIVIICKKKK